MIGSFTWPVCWGYRMYEEGGTYIYYEPLVLPLIRRVCTTCVHIDNIIPLGYCSVAITGISSTLAADTCW